jgi:hypothetical protein
VKGEYPAEYDVFAEYFNLDPVVWFGGRFTG